MAVTRVGNVIRMTTAGDAVSDRLIVQAIHAGPGLTIKNAAGTVVFITGSHGMNLSFPQGMQFAGLELDAGTGEIDVFLQ